MKELFSYILTNLVMVFSFLLPLFLIRVSDIFLGCYIARKININFDIHKLRDGLIFTLLLLIGIACFVTALVITPHLISYYELTNMAEEAMSNVVNTVMLVVLIIMSIVTYGKDCYEKLKVIFSKQEKVEDKNQ